MSTRTHQAPQGRCTFCGAHLSKYRDHDETICAPCSRDHDTRPTSHTRPSSRFDRGRDLLADGLTFDQVAWTLGWSSGPTACKAIRNYEDDLGLPRAGRTRPRVHSWSSR